MELVLHIALVEPPYQLPVASLVGAPKHELDVLPYTV
jgi:hypothetical protein